ncbi:MAG TPA: hypothetical protein VIW70_06530 [Rubrivivax sp.]
MMKTDHWTLQSTTAMPAERRREAAADVLRTASVLLARLATRLRVATRARPSGEPVLEFYAEAGAPEGALYVDGHRVGVLHGVTRL